MKKETERQLDFEIDKLTNSIENTLTHEVFDTEVTRLFSSDSKQIKKREWLFDWKAEIQNPNNEVYKLTTTNNPMIVHGLISISDKRDHIFLNLIESALFNRGSQKLYGGVAGNLVANVYRHKRSNYFSSTIF